MSAPNHDGFSFVGYPDPKPGPNIPYRNGRKKNPAIRGKMVVYSASLMERFSLVRATVWRNAGFNSLRKIRFIIEDYEPRYDPAVTPVTQPLLDLLDIGNARHSQHVKAAPKPNLRYSIADYQALYISGELTPTAVAKAILPLIRRDLKGEHSLAWIDVKEDLVLKAAEASTLRYARKVPLGPLDGIPTAVKDDYDFDGYKTTLGSLNDYTPEKKGNESISSWCVKKLEESGAVILGKLSMHEFGLDTSGNNPNYGTPLNPYNTRYYTGGSSSGPAYAVSTGLVPIALGADGGGSIRIPSSFCGVYGLKPSHNRLSQLPSANHSNTCAVNGPIAADLDSLEELYHVISVPYPSSSFPAPSRNLPPPRRKLLGIPEAWFARSTEAIQLLCNTVIDKLVSNYGYTIVPITIPFLVEGQIAHSLTVLTDASTLLPKTTNLTAANKILLAIGSVSQATDFILAQKLRQLLMQHMASLWAEYPDMLIITPTTSCAGWPIKTDSELKYGVSDGDRTIKTMEYVWMANFLGLPALSIPAGHVSAKGEEDEGDVAGKAFEGRIPVGLMAMAEWTREDLLMRWGEEATSAHDEQSRPPNWVDVIERARKIMKEGKATTTS